MVMIQYIYGILKYKNTKASLKDICMGLNLLGFLQMPKLYIHMVKMKLLKFGMLRKVN
jgi:hypothetical protein